MIHREKEGGVEVLRLEHGKANALDLELFRELAATLDAAESSGARALVLTGQGSIFSAGVDLIRVLEEDAGYLERFLPALDAGLRRLFLFPRPVVAAVNGHAIAGGCILAAACDRRVMADGAGRLGVPELLVGVPFPVLALEVLRALLPAETLRELVYSGRTLLPPEAQEAGLVDELAAPDDLLERAVEAASGLGRLAPDAFALTKRQLRRPAVERAERLAELDREVTAVWQREDTAAAIRRYVEATFGSAKKKG